MEIGNKGIDPTYVVGTPENAALHSEGRHPGVVSALAWLAFSHLPPELRYTSRPFYDAAVDLINNITVDSAELTTALNKLIEAKDWAVRAGVRRTTGRPGPMPRPQEIVDPPVVFSERPEVIDPRANEPRVSQLNWTSPRPDQTGVPGLRPIRDNPQA